MQEVRQQHNRTNLRVSRNTDGALGKLNKVAEKNRVHCRTAHGATQETVREKDHKKDSKDKCHKEDTKDDCPSHPLLRGSRVNLERPYAWKSTERLVCSTTAVNGETPAKRQGGQNVETQEQS